MARFGWGKSVDTEELQTQLKEKQEQLLAQLAEFDTREQKGGKGRFMLGLLLGSAVGATALYFFDAEKGEERRQGLVGAASSLAGGSDDSIEQDQLITGRVETELFRDATIPKGQISVSTVDSVVYLRGTASSQQQIDTIEQRVKALSGVEAVINLLRLPTTATAQ